MQFMTRSPVARSESMPTKSFPRTFERSSTTLVEKSTSITIVRQIDDDMEDRNSQHAKIIMGFPGIGKSTLTQHAEEYSEYNFLRILDEPNYAKGKEAEFLEGLLVLAKQKDTVLLLPAHPMIGAFLIKQKLAFTSVYPRRDAKKEYMTRYKNRGSPAGFMKLLNDNWESFISNMNYPHGRCNHVELETGQFLQGVFKDIINPKDADP